MSQDTQCFIAAMQLTTVGLAATWLGYLFCDNYINPLSKTIQQLRDELDEKDRELLSLRNKVDRFVSSLIENESDSDETDSVASNESNNECPHY